MNSQALTVTKSPTLPALDDLRPFYTEWLAGKKPTTVDQYRRGLQVFADWAGIPDLDAACRHFLDNGSGHAHRVALAFKAHLADSGLAPNSVNARLTALRSLVDFAGLIGRIEWTLRVKDVRREAYKDTRGPGVDGVRAMLEEVRSRTGKKAVRDEAILSLLFGLALRRGEVASLDLEHVDFTTGRIAILGKGHHERKWHTLPAPVCRALSAWVELRGDHDGALFVPLSRNGATGRLSPRSIYKAVKDAGEAVGLKVWPHALRHSAATHALDNHDVRTVRAFTRHAKIETLLIYDDNRQDFFGQVAGAVAAVLEP